MSIGVRPTGEPALRASDADREAVVEELRQHHLEGRLNLEEFQDRVDTAYGARTLGELMSALVDLPAPALPQPTSPPMKRLMRPLFGYGVTALVLLAVVLAVVTGPLLGFSARQHGYSFALPFLIFGIFWMRRGRRGGSSCRRHAPGAPASGSDNLNR